MHHAFKDSIVKRFPSGFLVDFIKVLFGNIHARIFSALITIILARVLGPTKYGIFSIGFMIITFTGMGLQGIDSSFVHYASKAKSGKGKILNIESSYFFLKIFFLTILILSGFFLSKLISIKFFHDANLSSVIFWGFIGAGGFILFTYIPANFQSMQKFSFYSLSYISYYFLVFFAVAILGLFKVKVPHFYISCYGLGGLLIFLFFALVKKGGFIHSNIFRNPDFKLLSLGKWIIISEFLWMGYTNIDLLLLSRYFSGQIIGEYSGALKLVNIFSTFTASFSVILLPKASKISDNEQLRSYFKSSLKLVGVTIAIFGLGILLSRVLSTFFLGSAYVHSPEYMRILLIAYFFIAISLPLRYSFYSFGRTDLLALQGLVQMITLIISGIFLIPKFYGLGAIYSKMIGNFVGMVTAFILVGYLLKHASNIK